MSSGGIHSDVKEILINKHWRVKFVFVTHLVLDGCLRTNNLFPLCHFDPFQRFPYNNQSISIYNSSHSLVDHLSACQYICASWFVGASCPFICSDDTLNNNHSLVRSSVRPCASVCASCSSDSCVCSSVRPWGPHFIPTNTAGLCQFKIERT